MTSKGKERDPPGLSRLQRVALGLALTVGLVLLDGVLVWWLQKVSLEEGVALDPVSRDVELVLREPTLRTRIGEDFEAQGKSLFGSGVSAVRPVEAVFSGIELGERAAELLEIHLCAQLEDPEDEGPPPPPQCGRFEELESFSLFTADYSSQASEGEAAEGCRLSIDITSELEGDPCLPRIVELDDAVSPPTRPEIRDALELRLSKLSEESLNLYSERGRLGVCLKLVAPPGDPRRPDCRAGIATPGWVEGGNLYAPLSFGLVVPPGGSADFELELRPSKPGADGPLAGLVPLRIRSLEMRPCPGCGPVVKAQGSDDEAVVSIDAMNLLPDGFQMALSGEGWLRGDSSYLPPEHRPMARFKSRLESHWILGLLWVALNGWALRLITKHVLEEPLAAGWQWLRSRFGRSTQGSDAEASGDSESPPVNRPEAREPPRREAPPTPPGRRSSGSRPP